MPLRLALVIDKSQSYISFQKARFLEDWGVTLADTKSATKLSQVGGATLFGPAPTAIVTLSDSDSVKEFVAELETALKAKTIEQIAGSGIIILTDVARTSTKKLEKLIADNGGQIRIAAAQGKGSTSEKLVNELHLNREAKDFLIAYVGDDYESLIPILRTVGSLPPQQQQKITIESLMIRMPQPPGGVPPWEIEGPLMNGNMSKAIEVFRRVSANSHYLVILAILRNKMQLSYRVSTLVDQNPRIGTAELAELLGVPNNYPLKLALGYAKKYGSVKLTKAVQALSTTEAKVKGRSSANGAIIMETMLVEINQIFRG